MRTKRSGIAIPSYERPQIYDPEILPLWRRYAKLHTQLNPYLRAADATYRRTGMPIMRHHLLTDPRRPAGGARARTSSCSAPALLAAPVVAPDQTEQRVYAPRGRWVDFWRSGSLPRAQRRLLAAAGEAAARPARTTRCRRRSPSCRC